MVIKTVEKMLRLSTRQYVCRNCIAHGRSGPGSSLPFLTQSLSAVQKVGFVLGDSWKTPVDLIFLSIPPQPNVLKMALDQPTSPNLISNRPCRPLSRVKGPSGKDCDTGCPMMTTGLLNSFLT